jgi:hypothetical protein
MATADGGGPIAYARLRPESLAGLDWNRLTRDAFRSWARTRRRPPINVPAQAWRPLREGRPVRRAIVEAFSEYIADVRGLLPPAECRYSRIAADCDPPAPEGRVLRPTFEATWSVFSAYLNEFYGLHERAYCADEADLELAASLVMEYLAAQEGKLPPGPAALAFAEEYTRVRLDEYARHLKDAWTKNEHCVLFATLEQGGTVRRVGVSALCPLTDGGRDRFLRGEIDATDLAPDDILATGDCVLATGFAENPRLDLRRDKATRAMALLRTTCYQLAALLRPIDQVPRPTLVALAGTGENGRRLRNFGFSPTGARTPRAGHDIVQFAEPSLREFGLRYPVALGEYHAMRNIVRVYQSHIAVLSNSS